MHIGTFNLESSQLNIKTNNNQSNKLRKQQVELTMEWTGSPTWTFRTTSAARKSQ